MYQNIHDVRDKHVTLSNKRELIPMELEFGDENVSKRQRRDGREHNFHLIMMILTIFQKYQGLLNRIQGMGAYLRPLKQ